jgi:hypothetical protein
MRRAAVTCLAVFSTLLLACSEDRRAMEGEETRVIMAQILSNLRVLLPLRWDPVEYRNPENHVRIARALHQISEQTQVLESHVDPGDAQMHYLARNIAEDAAAARRAFDSGRVDRSSFLVERITENCIVCHSRLPSPGDSPLSHDFVDLGALADVSLEERASLQIATRRFDDAMRSLEALLASPEPPAILLGPITDYLVVAIRVKNDLPRAAGTLKQFSQRADLWEQLRVDVEKWIAALHELQPALSSAPSLDVAREVRDAALVMNASPGSRAGLVHFIVASAILERTIGAGLPPGPELGEAYFLLGLIEARIGRNYWVTEAPFLLETAIRMAPKQPYAREAYAILERELQLTYEGSSQEELPPEESSRLAVLRQMID